MLNSDQMGNRREFLKKGFIGGLGIVALNPLLAKGGKVRTISYRELNKLSMNNDWESIRTEFLYEQENSYLNTASLGLSPKLVVQTINESIVDLEKKGRDGRWLFKDCRAKLAKLVNASEEEIAITRNATEGMNIVARSLKLKEGDEILLSKHEHIGGSAPWLALQKEIGVKIKVIDLDLSGLKNLQLIKDAVSEKTKVISLSHLLCTTGMVLPAKEIAAFCREKKIYSCLDGAQALGCIPTDLKEINPDFYIASGHKWLFGPKGTGMLYINSSVIDECKPTFVGAYTDSDFDLLNQQMEYRTVAEREEYGTRNASIVKGMEASIDFIQAIGIEKIKKRGMELSNYLREALNEINSIEILSPSAEEYASPILTFRFKGSPNAEIVSLLRSNNNLVIRHIYEGGLDAIRISNAIYNSEKDLDRLINAVKSI